MNQCHRSYSTIFFLLLEQITSGLETKKRTYFIQTCVDIKGAVRRFGKEIHTQNFNIQKINEVIIQTKIPPPPPRTG